MSPPRHRRHSTPSPKNPRIRRQPPSPPADHDRPSRSLAGRRPVRAEPRTYPVVWGGIQGRIGQANEPTSPSPTPIHPRRIREPGGRSRRRGLPAEPVPESASSQGGGETGWSSIVGFVAQGECQHRPVLQPMVDAIRVRVYDVVRIASACRSSSRSRARWAHQILRVPLCSGYTPVFGARDTPI